MRRLPFAKPLFSPKAPRAFNSTLPKASKPIARSGPPKKRNAKRRVTEFARCYHSRKRVLFVKGLPCIICGHGPCDNAHIENGGAGRKADYAKIVPLCCMPMDHPYSPGYPRGHHGELHRIGVKSFLAGLPVVDRLLHEDGRSNRTPVAASGAR